MKLQMKLRQVLTVAALLGASALTACGGGGGSSSLTPQMPTSGKKTPQQGVGHAFIPAGLTTASGQRRPQYIDPNGTSSLVVTVTPTDPAELAQWGTLQVCYNIFTNGAPASPLAPGVTITPIVGPPAGFNITFPFPAIPGQSSYVITQYAGACSATNPYAPPTPGPGQTAAGLIISQAQPLNITVPAGGAANFNVQLAACTATPAAPALPTLPTCPVPNPAGTTTLTPTLGAQVTSVYLAQASPAPSVLPNPIPLPIVAPVREQGAFLIATDNVAMPAPVVGLDANGFPVPYTKGTVAGTNPSSGLLPKAPLNIPANGGSCTAACNDAVTLASTVGGAFSAHGHLVMLDAKTGAIVQQEAAGAPITITAVNGIDTTDNAFGAAHGGFGAGTLDDQYVIALLTDGSAATQVTSYTITLAGTVNGAAVPVQTLTVAPQSSVYSAVAAGAPASGYNDAAGAYTAAADVISTFGVTGLVAPATGIWITDGQTIAEAGNAHFSLVAAGAVGPLTGLNLDAFVGTVPQVAPELVATDNGTAAVASSLTPIAGGLFMLNPAVPATNKAVAIQNTSGDYIAYKAPEGVAKVEAGVNGATYLYVFENNNIIAVDPQVTGGGALVTVGGGSGACAAANSCYLAEQISNLTYATGSTAPSFSSVTGIGVLVSGTKLIFADPGNNRIASIDVSTCGPQASGSNLGACTVTTVASGHPFIGLGLAQGGTNYVATDTTGQIYLINGSTVSSFGLTTGSVQDGALGVVAPPAATTTAAPYLVQGNANNFFSTTATFTPTVPYNILPFAATAPVFNVAPNAALKILADTSNGTIVATAPGSVKAPFGIVWLPAAQVPPASPALTPDSYIFADNGNVRTLIP